MTPRTWVRVCGVAILGLLSATLSAAVAGQSLHSVVEPRTRVFPSVGSGVAALKQDASGRYYVLGKPATLVSIYAADGTLTEQIPNAKSGGVAIRYAVDFDLSSDGLIAVADRGSNAIEVFRADGSVVTRIPVVAPTSVVALAGGEFAVTSLTSERLIQILDERGKLLRSFGDPSDIEDLAQEDGGKRPLTDWGKIVGSRDGNIYFSFTSLPDLPLRKYDRYGYARYETSIPKEFFKARESPSQDRLEFTVNFTHLSFSDQTTGTFTIGSSGDVKFGGGVGTGLSRIIGSGGGFGRAAGQLNMWQTATGNTAGGTAGGLAGGSLGGMFTGEVTRQGTQFHFGLGNTSSARGGRRGGGIENAALDEPSAQGTTLQFFGSGNDSADQFDRASFGPSAALSFTVGDSGTGANSGSQSVLDNESYGGASINQDSALPAAFAYATLFNLAEPQGGGGGSFGHFPRGGARPGEPGGFGGMEEGRLGGAPFGDGQFRPHGRFGAGQGEVVASVRVNLGDIGRTSIEKPRITATTVDPATGELWAAAGDTLVRFSVDGNPLEVYYLTLKAGVPMKPTALLIEPDRFLVAADPWGIFEFERLR